MSSPKAASAPARKDVANALGSCKNIDLPTGAYSLVSGSTDAVIARPKPSTLGQAIKVGLNTYGVESFPAEGKDIFQYDVLIGNGVEKRGLMKKVWECPTVRKALNGFIWDGNALAWSLHDRKDELSITIDLDHEQGRPPRQGKKPNEFRIMVRQTKRIRFAALTEYLAQKTDFSVSVLECVNFFDHLLRENPAKVHCQIKRSFFKRSDEPIELGSAVELFKGVYQSLRIVHCLRNGAHAARLSINLDVANGAFWKSKPLHLVAVQLCGKRDVNDLLNGLARGGQLSREGHALLKFRKLRVVARHRGTQPSDVDNYVIQRLIYQSAQQFTFVKDDKKISIADYYARQYNIRLQYPALPLVETSKKQVLPMEILTVEANQRYLFKLDERQVSNMVKAAATPPADRYQSITRGIAMLDWANDPVLQKYGVKINPSRTVVDGRLLPAPKVQFGLGEAKPGTSGRWDLKGKKFLTVNQAPLTSWSVCVIPARVGGKPDQSIVQNFVKAFIQAYIAHGGRVENKQPMIKLAQTEKAGDAVTVAWNAAGQQSQVRPQILVFILPDKNADYYGRIKRSAECRYGVVSQCMQYAHVMKAAPQYISNVCMKFNAKLGGSTARAIGTKPAGTAGTITATTMIIGADVSHGAPGSQTPSMAALTVSMDKFGVRYAAACETNGYRSEMITTANIESILAPMITTWKDRVGGNKWPERIFYFRDGVSERQYQHVIQQEVHDMRTVFKRLTGVVLPFIVIIGSKRHHVRFFPERGDRNGNALPGTLVETGVTHPFENDFYLCTHAAIKGTARPTHYHVLLNDTKLSNEDIQTLLYDQCYQFTRATTPVSQHPAMYYAHIAASRAVPHDPKWGNPSEERSSVDSRQAGGTLPPVDKLMEMPNAGSIRTSMWYI